MAYIIRPNGDADLANATIHAETTLPQTISGLAAGTYEVGRISWVAAPVAVSAPAIPVPSSTAAPSISGAGKIGEAQVGVDTTWDIVPDEIESRWLVDGSPLGASDASYTPDPANDRLDLTFEQRARKTGGVWSAWVTSTPVTVTHVAPRATRGLLDQSFTRGTGVQTYDPSDDFVGQALSFTLAAPRVGVSIDAATGVISIDTDTTGSLADVTVTVQATNSGGQATSGFTLDVVAAAAWSATGEAGRITVATAPAITGPVATGSTGQLTITA